LKRAVVVEVPPLSLDRRRPLAQQITEGLRAAIRSGRLRLDDRVPATRAFAKALGVSRQVIITAYEELAASGHLRGRIGDGSYVAGTETRPLVSRSACTLRDPDGHPILVWLLQ